MLCCNVNFTCQKLIKITELPRKKHFQLRSTRKRRREDRGVNDKDSIFAADASSLGNRDQGGGGGGKTRKSPTSRFPNVIPVLPLRLYHFILCRVIFITFLLLLTNVTHLSLIDYLSSVSGQAVENLFQLFFVIGHRFK